MAGAAFVGVALAAIECITCGIINIANDKPCLFHCDAKRSSLLVQIAAKAAPTKAHDYVLRQKSHDEKKRHLSVALFLLCVSCSISLFLPELVPIYIPGDQHDGRQYREQQN